MCGGSDNVTRSECKCSLSALAGVKVSVGAGIQTSGPIGLLENNGTSFEGRRRRGRSEVDVAYVLFTSNLLNLIQSEFHLHPCTLPVALIPQSHPASQQGEVRCSLDESGSRFYQDTLPL